MNNYPKWAACAGLGTSVAMAALGCSRNIFVPAHEAANQKLFREAAIELPGAIADCKKEGIPLKISDLYKSIPESENAAPQYEKLFPAIDKLPISVTRTMLAPDRQFDETKVEAALTQSKDLLAGLRKALAYPRCYFKPTSAEFIVEFRVTSSLKMGAGLLALDARYQASKKNFAAAVADVADIYRIERHLAEESAVVADLVAVDIQKDVTHTLEVIMESCKADPSVAAAFIKVIDASLPKLPTGPPFKVEILPHYSNVPTHWNRKDLDVENPSLGRILDSTSGVEPSDVVAAFQARALQFGIALYHAANEGHETGREKLEAFQKIGDDEDSGDGTHCWMSFVGAEFGEALSTIIKFSELRDCSLLGLEIIKDHKSGTPWPKSLPAGGPAEELTGKSFSYKSSGAGFEVYAARIEELPSNGTGVWFRYPTDYLPPKTR